MNFQIAFAYLIDTTKTTITDLAKYTSFDRSYISKWYNGKAIPTEDNWPELRQSLAEYFSAKMNRDMVEDLKKTKLFTRTSPLYIQP